jgi:HSP20 family protein
MTTGLTRWNANPDILRQRVDRLFDRAFSDFLAPVNDDAVSTRRWMPPVDIRESGDALMLSVDLPGVKKEDVQITLENNVLTVGGERKFEKDVEEENYHRIERAYGSFARSFTVPGNLRHDQIQASFENGVLTVTLPKADEAKPRKIDIK